MAKRILFSTRWYEQRVHLGVLKYAQAHHWDVLSSHHMPAMALQVPNVDGQIVETGLKDRRRLRFIREYQGPVVGLEDFGEGLDIPRVHTDNRAVGRLAAQHLLDRGFRQFATLSRMDFMYVRQRLEGFQEAVGKEDGSQCLNIRLTDPWHTNDPQPRSPNRAQLDKLLGAERPVGVFCIDDEDANALIRFLLQRGVTIPEEYAVVGVNDDPLICQYASVPISSVDPGFEDIGFAAASLLDRMMQGKRIPVRTHLIQPKGVVMRRSSDIRAVSDSLMAKALLFIWDQAESWVSVGDIAAHVGLPVRTLQWRFSRSVGHSLQEEMTRSRIERVKDRLLTTNKTAKQIAEEMNFSSVQYMMRLFSKETGVSPLTFRRSHRDA